MITDSRTPQTGFTMSNEYTQPARLQKMYIHLQDSQNLICNQTIHSPGSFSTNGKEKHVLPVKSAIQAVREALPLGLHTVRLSGQNSLCHSDLDMLLDELESLELIIEIETNGIGLTPQRLNRLARLPQSSIAIGLNGADANTHDYFTMRGAFDYATRAIRVLSASGIPVHTVYTARRRNFNQLPALVRLVEELGAESIRVITLPPTKKAGKNGNGNGNDNGNGNGNGHRQRINPSPRIDLNLSMGDELHVEELIALGWRVERDLACTTPVRLIFEQPPAFRGLHPTARIDGQERCGILSSLSMTAAGQYTLCGLGQDLPGLVLGEISQHSLNEIWTDHPTLQLLREGLPGKLEGVCERCAMKNTCLGSCPVENFIRTGSFWSPGWFCESAERVGLFPAGRLIENYW